MYVRFLRDRICLRLRVGVEDPVTGIVTNELRGFVLSNNAQWSRRAINYTNGMRAFQIARVDHAAVSRGLPLPVVAEGRPPPDGEDFSDDYWTVEEKPRDNRGRVEEEETCDEYWG